MSTEAFTTSWQWTRVNTAASPFGPSFSEIIAGTMDPEIAESNWTTAVDVMIPKKGVRTHHQAASHRALSRPF
jgi:hypothetical protein